MISDADRRLAELDVVAVERALIGGLLVDGGPPFPPLLPDEFHLDAHRTLWAELADMQAQGDPITPVLVADRLSRRGLLAAVGGPAALAFGMVEGCVEVHRLRYAQLVRDAARARALHRLGLELAQQGLDEADVRAKLSALPGPVAPALYDPVESMDAVMRRWNELLVPTGLVGVDQLVGGFLRGQVVLVVGITSHGKTAFVCHLARKMAEAGTRVDLVTLEETTEGITRRLASALTGISAYRILTGDVARQDLAKLADAALYIRSLPLRVTGPGSSSLRTFDAATVLGVVGRSDADVVIVDHMQKILTQGDSRAYGLEAVMNGLHLLALRDNRVILATAQSGRLANAERRPPRESDLRDSGALEMFARQVWAAYWPVKHDPKRAPNDYELHVLKNAEGPTGVVALGFEAYNGRFSG